MRKPLVLAALVGIVVWLVIDGPSYVKSNPINTCTTTVGEVASVAPTIQTLAASWTNANSSTSSSVAGINLIRYGDASTTVVTETYTFVSIYSHTVTSTSTSHTTTTTATTATQTIVNLSTLWTTTTTTSTSTSWLTQTSTSMVSRTSTSMAFLTSLTTVTSTNPSTSLHPTVIVTSMNTSYSTSTIFSPTLTVTFTQTSVIPATSLVTEVRATTTTTTTTVAIARPCAIASAAYGSELVPQVQTLREFRDRTVMSTFAGAQFMRVFNAFYYSFSPIVVEAILANQTIRSVVRTMISPLIAALQISSCMSCLLPLNPELTTLLGGLLASCLIGLIYVTPFVSLMTIRKKTRTPEDL